MFSTTVLSKVAGLPFVRTGALPAVACIRPAAASYHPSQTSSPLHTRLPRPCSLLSTSSITYGASAAIDTATMPEFEHESGSKTEAVCTVRSLDHLVLTVSSLERTASFYSLLGMRHTKFHSGGVDRHALVFGGGGAEGGGGGSGITQKINLHEAGREFEPKAARVQVGSADLCFLIEDDVRDVGARLEKEGVEVLEMQGERDIGRDAEPGAEAGGAKVVLRTGARGRMRSLYVRDPDGNLVELSNYIE